MNHAFDTTVRPQDDYFGYVNNPWLAKNPIPKTETSWGTFYVLRDKSWNAVNTIINELSASDTQKLSHDQTLLRTFFASALTFESSTKQLSTLQKLINRIESVTERADLPNLIGYLHRHGIGAFWAPYISQDDQDSSIQILRLYQAGLGLPNRDYYLDTSSRMKKLRAAYATFYEDLKNILPATSLLDNHNDAYAVEHAIAKFSWTDIALRDAEKNYTHYSLKDLIQTVPFDWTAYFGGLGWAAPSDHISIDQNSFVMGCVSLMKDLPINSIKAYLKWKLIVSFSSWLSEDTAIRAFEFYGTTLSGQQEMKPLWKRAVLLADRQVIGEALGREYAVRHFPESSKKAVEQLVEDIRTTYHKRITALTWMSDETKQRAHTKLDNIRVFIGYPSIWKDLSRLSFIEDDIMENIVRAESYEMDLQLAKIGQASPAEEWEMNAHVVNAYNHPNRLEIVFPAAILQPPFYDPKASRAANLGGIGAVIGHELTHSFDDEGSHFDEHGNVQSWQTDGERKAFDTLAEHIVKQADAFETAPGVFLQGKLILGEAIADIGGLTLAVDSLENPGELKELFINFAQCECGHITEERAIELAKIDPHPPSRFRVNNVVNHVDAFYDAYGVKPSDKLYLPPEQRARIW